MLLKGGASQVIFPYKQEVASWWCDGVIQTLHVWLLPVVSRLMEREHRMALNSMQTLIQWLLGRTCCLSNYIYIIIALLSLLLLRFTTTPSPAFENWCLYPHEFDPCWYDVDTSSCWYLLIRSDPTTEIRRDTQIFSTMSNHKVHPGVWKLNRNPMLGCLASGTKNRNKNMTKAKVWIDWRGHTYMQ